MLSGLEPMCPNEILELLAAPRRRRADAIRECYSSGPGGQKVAEHLIQLEIDDDTRSAVVSLLRENLEPPGP